MFVDQLQRLMEQRHLTERDSKLMIGAQMNMDKKVTPIFARCIFLYLVHIFVCCIFVIWCSGSNGPVCDWEQWIPSRHPRAGEEKRSKLENHVSSTGFEDPWKLVQILLPLESEVTLGSGHWGALWDRLPCLKKGEDPLMIKIQQINWILSLVTISDTSSPPNVKHTFQIDCRDPARWLSSNIVEEALLMNFYHIVGNVDNFGNADNVDNVGNVENLGNLDLYRLSTCIPKTFQQQCGGSPLWWTFIS